MSRYVTSNSAGLVRYFITCNKCGESFECNAATNAFGFVCDACRPRCMVCDALVDVDGPCSDCATPYREPWWLRALRWLVR